ncbi:MAG: sigma-70 family RNA polymerase sigma factor [Phycisphaerae bacterium]|nr:sigma-70 family RNA polymerase sigma factor [Phycisphaerae bacterium]
MCLSDKQYIDNCLKGSPDDFRYLVKKYQGALLGYLVGRLGCNCQIDDIAQEAFVRAYFGLKTLKEPDSFYSWLTGIASRVAKEQFRSEQKHCDAIQSIRETQQEQNEKKEPYVGHDLQRAIEKLSESYQEVILLRYYCGLSCKQMADRLDMPLGTVTKKLSRAYEMLRDFLRQENKTEMSK